MARHYNSGMHKLEQKLVRKQERKQAKKRVNRLLRYSPFAPLVQERLDEINMDNLGIGHPYEQEIESNPWVIFERYELPEPKIPDSELEKPVRREKTLFGGALSGDELTSENDSIEFGKWADAELIGPAQGSMGRHERRSREFYMVKDILEYGDTPEESKAARERRENEVEKFKKDCEKIHQKHAPKFRKYIRRCDQIRTTIPARDLPITEAIKFGLAYLCFGVNPGDVRVSKV